MPETEWDIARGGNGLWDFCDRAASHSQPVSDESDRSPAMQIGCQRSMVMDNPAVDRTNAHTVSGHASTHISL